MAEETECPPLWVWLRVRHRVPASLPDTVKDKLRPRFYGPYQVVAVINEVAYRLALPPGTRLHDVIHVGLLKPFVGVPPSSPPALPPIKCGAVQPVPRQVVCVRYNRGWFYHKEVRVWLTRIPNVEPLVKTPHYERGSYGCFDPNNWETIRKDNFVLHYDQIEKKPAIPSSSQTVRGNIS
nr:unknown protein [Oryza sativa Japonica Group]